MRKLVFLSLLCPWCFFWCSSVSPYLLELAGEKGQAVSSCSLKSNRQDTAERCLFSLALCSHFISHSIVPQEGAQASADVVKRPLHTHSSDTPSCPLHLYVPRTRLSPPGEPFCAYAACLIHMLDSCFELSR